jgi:integrase
MAFVRKKSNSPYWQGVYIDETGVRRERSTKSESQKAALKIAEEWEWMARKARRGELTQAAILKTMGEILERTTGEPLTIQNPAKQFFKEWVREKESAGRAPSTVKRYRAILDEFVAFLGKQRASLSLSGVAPSDIVRFRDKKLKDGCSASTADQNMKILGAAFETARRRSIILSNPVQAVDPLGGQQEQREPFTDDQVRLLIRQADNAWRGMILFGYYTGIRIHDAANLTWGNIDLDAHTLTFAESKTARRKRGNKQTTVYLHPEVLAWLGQQRKGIAKSPLFPTLKGKASGTTMGLSVQFAKLMKACSIAVPMGEKKKGKGRQLRKLSFHSLRHTFISRLANAEVSADVRMAMSGHSSDDIHRRYVHLDLSAQKAAVAKLPTLGQKALEFPPRPKI